MTDVRKRFVQLLETHPLVEDVDFTRDGYETVVLELEDAELDTDANGVTECPVCGAVGLEERIDEHDCHRVCEWRAGQ